MKTAALTALACAAAVVAAPLPASAATSAPTRTILDGHVSLATVTGALPAGAGVSVVHSCPKGHDLDRRQTRDVEPVVDERLRLASREYWVGGTVSRFTVRQRLRSGEPAFVVTAALCRSRVTGNVATGAASVDLRVWGPAPAKVGLEDAAVTVVTDDLTAGRLFATSMRAASVASAAGSLRGAVRATQEAFDEGDGLAAVVATGRTTKRVAKGRFVSMVNRYSYRADLTRLVEF